MTLERASPTELPSRPATVSAASDPSFERPRVVYVAGRGHSGSTLLDLLLGTHSRVTSVGEAKQLGTSPHKRCTCGAPGLGECPFWSSVDAELARSGLALGSPAIGEGPADEVRRYNEAFFRAVARVSGNPVVVDSSKNRRRLEHLVSTGLDLRVVHLIREPAGVVSSGLARGRSLGDECRQLRRETLRTRRLLSGRPHLVVRYEDLARQPQVELGLVMSWLGLELEPRQLTHWRGGERHNFGGNAMRFGDDEAVIRLDERWRERLTPWQKLSIALRTWPARVEHPLLVRWLCRVT